MKLKIWAQRWGIPHEAIEDLRKIFGVGNLELVDSNNKQSEAAILNIVRMEASKKGCRLWRNNIGAVYSAAGNFIRFGLANESDKMNDFIKSADLIGVRPLKIRDSMVGMVIGQFLSREIKNSDWKYKGTDEETAQLRWVELITSLGGDACFANKEGTI